MGAFELSRLIESVVPAIWPDETLILVSSADLLFAAVAAACYLPSRTATMVDLATILRSENRVFTLAGRFEIEFGAGRKGSTEKRSRHSPSKRKAPRIN